MGPELRRQKLQQIKEAFNRATVFYKEGEIDAAFDGLVKLQGMAAAFHGVDGALYHYTTDTADTLALFLAQPDTRDFTAWALFRACKALAGLKGPLEANDEPQAEGLFHKAVVAWDSRNVEAFDEASSQLFELSRNLPLGNKAGRFHSLLVNQAYGVVGMPHLSHTLQEHSGWEET